MLNCSKLHTMMLDLVLQLHTNPVQQLLDVLKSAVTLWHVGAKYLELKLEYSCTSIH